MKEILDDYKYQPRMGVTARRRILLKAVRDLGRLNIAGQLRQKYIEFNGDQWSIVPLHLQNDRYWVKRLEEELSKILLQYSPNL